MARTWATFAASLRLRNVVTIYSAINGISASRIPCVVTDGVPIRTPEVTNGLRGSLGIAFYVALVAAVFVAWQMDRFDPQVTKALCTGEWVGQQVTLESTGTLWL